VALALKWPEALHEAMQPRWAICTAGKIRQRYRSFCKTSRTRPRAFKVLSGARRKLVKLAKQPLTLAIKEISSLKVALSLLEKLLATLSRHCRHLTLPIIPRCNPEIKKANSKGRLSCPRTIINLRARTVQQIFALDFLDLAQTKQKDTDATKTWPPNRSGTSLSHPGR
jgi:hypothetical protein